MISMNNLRIQKCRGANVETNGKTLESEKQEMISMNNLRTQKCRGANVETNGKTLESEKQEMISMNNLRTQKCRGTQECRGTEMKLAAQLYTVRDFTKTEADIYETLKKIKTAGYNAVQLSGMGPCPPESLRDMLAEFELNAFATHTPIDRIAGDTAAVIKEHKMWGAEYVGLGWFRGKNIGEYAQMLQRLAPALDEINGSGLKFVYHNHAHEFIRFDGVRPLDYMRDNTAPEKFGFLADFYWVQFAGLSPEHFLEQYKGRVEAVHLKDMKVSGDGMQAMAEIFEGNMDYVSVCRACKRAGVRWAAVEQDECGGDPFDSLKLSFANIAKHIPRDILSL